MKEAKAAEVAIYPAPGFGVDKVVEFKGYTAARAREEDRKVLAAFAALAKAREWVVLPTEGSRKWPGPSLCELALAALPRYSKEFQSRHQKAQA